MNFHPEERSPQGFLFSEGTVSPQPSSLTSIISDPAPSAQFSPLRGPSQPGFYHRNRNTALFSPSGTFERHSSGTAESEWEDYGDADHALDDVKRQARLSAWTTLTASVVPPVGGVSAHSPNEQDELRDRTREFLANLSPLVLRRPESTSSASFSIDLDFQSSVASPSNTPYINLVASQPAIGEWEETRYNAMRSSTELVRHSVSSVNALADLIKRLGLNDDGTEKYPPSDTSPSENMITPEVPPHPVKNDTLFESYQAANTLAAKPPPPPHTCPNCSAIPASHPSTFESAPSSFIQPTYFSVHKGSEVSYRPILDIDANDSSFPVPYHPYQTRERQAVDPFGPGNESFLPDMSGSKRAKKAKRPAAPRQPTGPYMDPLPASFDSRTPGKKGGSQTQDGYPKSSSRAARTAPSHWPPLAPSQSRASSQHSFAVSSPIRSTTPKSSRSDTRTNKSEKGGWSLEKWFPAPPMGQVKDAA